CQAAVLPALRREGLPKTVIEAMAYGVPPIVTAVGGSPELVNDHEQGLVVPPGDAPARAAAILELYRDPALRARLGAAARERLAPSFTIEATVGRTLALYREVLGAEAGTSGPGVPAATLSRNGTLSAIASTSDEKR